MILSACNAATEPNDYAYVVAIGVDKAQTDGQFEISVQFAKPAQISGGSSEQGGSGAETLGIVTVEAPSIYSGINIANNLVSKKFQLSHTKIIVISDELAKEGISRFIYTIERSNDLRPNMFVAISNGKAKEYLAEVKPEMEINPVKYYQLVFDNSFAELVPKISSQHTYFYMDSDEKDIILPLVSKSKKGDTKQKESQGGESDGGSQSDGDKGSQQSEEKSIEIPKSTSDMNFEGFEYMLRNYAAGDISANKDNKTETLGMAVFSNDKMVAKMSGIESEIYNMLCGNFKYSYNTFYCGNSDIPVVMQTQQIKKPKISVEVDGKNPKIGVKLYYEGSLVSAADDYFVEEDIYNYEEEISGYIKGAVEKFLERTSRELGTDIVGFGSYAKKAFSTTDEFENYDWKEKFSTADFFVDVKFKIRRTGAVIKNREGQ